MSQKQRDKQDKRRRREERRAASAAKRDERRGRELAALEAKKVFCPNCDTHYLPGDPDPIHRDGLCDCDEATRRAMTEFMELRSAQFDAAETVIRDPVSGEPASETGTGCLVCVSCKTSHDRERQASLFIEGRLVWDGCDFCLESVPAQYAIEQARMRWGWQPKAILIGGVEQRFRPDPMRTVRVAARHAREMANEASQEAPQSQHGLALLPVKPSSQS